MNQIKDEITVFLQIVLHTVKLHTKDKNKVILLNTEMYPQSS